MALNDITIDTNVIAHSENEIEERKQESLDFLNYILSSTENLCLDYQGNRNFNIKASIIWQEYNDRIPSQSFGARFLQKMLNNKRIVPTSRSLNQRERKIINQKVTKPNDRTFLKTTFNSDSKILVSHDFEDFQQKKRNILNNKIDIFIIEASDFMEQYID